MSLIDEIGNKGQFDREIGKAWQRRFADRLERNRLFKELFKDPPPKHMYGKEADTAKTGPNDFEMRQAFAKHRKETPVSEEPAAATEVGGPPRRQMPPAEAVKVLHLSDASKEEIEKRYQLLLKANGDAGSSQYLMDKITHARDVALSHSQRGTLAKHLKIKKEEKPTDTPPL